MAWRELRCYTILMSEEQIVYNPDEKSYLRQGGPGKKKFSDRILLMVAAICLIAAAVIFYYYT